MKLKYEFCFQPFGDKYVGVAVGESEEKFSGVLELDEVAYEMVSRMTKEISREELIDELLTIYDDERELVGKYLDKVTNYLQEQDVLA